MVVATLYLAPLRLQRHPEAYSLALNKNLRLESMYFGATNK